MPPSYSSGDGSVDGPVCQACSKNLSNAREQAQRRRTNRKAARPGRALWIMEWVAEPGPDERGWPRGAAATSGRPGRHRHDRSRCAVHDSGRRWRWSTLPQERLNGNRYDAEPSTHDSRSRRSSSMRPTS
jgi:hypothetical protein